MTWAERAREKKGKQMKESIQSPQIFHRICRDCKHFHIQNSPQQQFIRNLQKIPRKMSENLVIPSSSSVKINVSNSFNDVVSFEKKFDKDLTIAKLKVSHLVDRLKHFFCNLSISQLIILGEARNPHRRMSFHPQTRTLLRLEARLSHWR